jgi:hypothetical protein
MNKRTINQEGLHTITTTINHNLWVKAHKKISWSEALRVGITTILSQLGDEEYINPLQQQRKIEKLALKVQDLIEENNKLREGFKNANVQ